MRGFHKHRQKPKQFIKTLENKGCFLFRTNTFQKQEQNSTTIRQGVHLPLYIVLYLQSGQNKLCVK